MREIFVSLICNAQSKICSVYHAGTTISRVVSCFFAEVPVLCGMSGYYLSSALIKFDGKLIQTVRRKH